ncbi:MAG: hypothetical protein ACREXM_12155 [Gammaproteobacteria bacterium]
MKSLRSVWPAIGIAILMSVAADGEARPIVIAHRGASGYLPHIATECFICLLRDKSNNSQPTAKINCSF